MLAARNLSMADEGLESEEQLRSTGMESSKRVGMGPCCAQGGRGTLVAVLLLLLLLAPSFTECATHEYHYDPFELDALEALRQAWSHTPNMSTNLAGWNQSVRTPCNQFFNRERNETNWRGVICGSFKDYYRSPLIRIVGLSLKNSSITGHLPEAITYLKSLSTLEISGNPKLTGTLPRALDNNYISILNLHDNDLYGDINEQLKNLWNLLKLDLSGNRFEGTFPTTALQDMIGLEILNLARNKYTGRVPSSAFMNYTQLEKLDISHNFFNGKSIDFSNNKKLQSLDLSKNKFEGHLPNLSTLSLLRVVNLSKNNFMESNIKLSSVFDIESLSILDVSDTSVKIDLYNAFGSIQEIYMDRTNMGEILNISRMFQLGLLQEKYNKTKNLHIVSLLYNNITSVIFSASLISSISTQFRLKGNPFCNTTNKNDGTRCYCDQLCFNSQDMQEINKKMVIITVTCSIGGFIALVIVVVAIYWQRSKKYKQYLYDQFQLRFQQFDVKPTIFSFNELRNATRDFHLDMKLGEGSYGAVYKGVFPDGSTMAVKRLLVKAFQGMDSFLNEVVLITGMKHRNLVSLKGCCLREHQRILVYEYIDNFDVDRVLFGAVKMDIHWHIRFNICLGVANGLHYLHALAQPRIIHRDIKAANILLDKNFEPKIADFGLALLFPDGINHIETATIAGTTGYLAPEYAARGQLSDKADVYSFGILCLEIISGRRNIVLTMANDQIYLSEWAWKLHKEGQTMALLDPSMDNLSSDEYEEVKKMINVALLCIQMDVESRPNMALVVAKCYKEKC